MNNNTPTRLDKYLAHSGQASRREAKEMIEQQAIRVNNQTATSPGQPIIPGQDTIEITHKHQSNKITVAVYKPRGYACTPDQTSGKTIFDRFPKFRHLNSVGRLDKDSEGLLLLSNDGLITKAITDQSHPSVKEYVVTVREDVLPWMVAKFESGLKIEGNYTTMPAEASKLDRHTFQIALREGKKHQIRRMANAVGLTIVSLKRTKINEISLGKMRPGQSRVLSDAEVERLKERVTSCVAEYPEALPRG